MSDNIRINFDITKKMNDDLTKLLPRGLKSEIYRGLLRLLIRDLKKKGFVKVIGPITEDTATITTVHSVNTSSEE